MGAGNSIWNHCDPASDLLSSSCEIQVNLEVPKKKIIPNKLIYLLLDLDLNLALLSVAANQRQEFMKILHCDWLPLTVRQD